MNKILIVIDMQNDFITGCLGTKEAKAIVPAVVEKVTNADELVFTKDTHYKDYMKTLEGEKLPIPHCIFGTEGHDLIPELQKYDVDSINKLTFGYTNWQWLEKYDEIEICGVCTDICVVSNALIIRAMFPDVKIVVDANACAGVTPEKHKAALEVMKSCQIDVIRE